MSFIFQGLDFLEDKPERLIEWIEMQYLTGANAITVYTYYMPSKMRHVLGYYATQKNLTQVCSAFFSNKCGFAVAYRKNLYNI